jgi:hypothetical protein
VAARAEILPGRGRMNGNRLSRVLFNKNVDLKNYDPIELVLHYPPGLASE